MFSRGLKVGAGALVAAGTAQYCVYAKDRKSYVIYAAPGMEEVALKLVREQPGKHRYLPIAWRKTADGSDEASVEGVGSGDLDDEDVLFLASFTDGAATLAQYHALARVCDAPINSMTVVAPYLPGAATGNTAGTTRLLSTLPACAAPLRIITYDAKNLAREEHAKIIPATTAHILADMIKRRNFNCVAFTTPEAQRLFAPQLDAARVGVSYLRTDMKCDELIPTKKTVQVMEGSPRGKHLLLVDSSISAATAAAAKKLASEGALSVSVFSTHAVSTSPNASFAALAGEPAVSKIFVTNSLPATQQLSGPKFEVVDLCPHIMKAI
ncbi:Ribose-phosphate pyrophosphokinase 4 [Diplonema papillatum]|nr:Ribose-phosphate pyrophosphokinase 4 [Diplonema papillatum]|eukprot:gene611-929_t